MKNSLFFLPIDRPQLSVTTPSQSECGSNDNEGAQAFSKALVF